ncbi:MAG: CehA/McbA family metallohydrolase [Dehalococcoidia bacterium]|nr:CehA/McbA family metallohydrolase [Dehalococcoidia bacterium]
MEQKARLQGRITEEQVRRSPFLYLPFPVPPRTRRVHVSYDYSDPVTAPFGLGPGNTVDIGIFDSRGHDFLEAPGFRGWSGTSKREFFLAPHEATPGYIRGPLFPGEWNVILGVDRIEPHGARYEVNITLDVAEDDAPAWPVGRPDGPQAGARPVPGGGPAPTRRTAGGEARWLKGDLHCHTLHSDGLNSVQELVVNAVEQGLDFLAVTDHNTNTHHEELDQLSHMPITLIPGEEITTYWGHANMWGLREWIEYRCADEESIAAVRRYVLQQGGLISVNHPKSVGPPWLFQGWEGYPCMEVWQAPWRFYNWESLERWDALLRRGDRVIAVGGSDTHSIPPAPPRHPHGLANPTTWVYAQGEPSEESVLDAIRRGHVFISDAPNGSHLILTADGDGDGGFEKMMGDTVEAQEGRRVAFRVQVHGGLDRRLWLICDGEPLDIIPLDAVDTDFRFSLEISGRGYVRAELRGHRGRPERGEVVWAMTNPIWLRVVE